MIKAAFDTLDSHAPENLTYWKVVRFNLCTNLSRSMPAADRVIVAKICRQGLDYLWFDRATDEWSKSREGKQHVGFKLAKIFIKPNAEGITWLKDRAAQASSPLVRDLLLTSTQYNAQVYYPVSFPFLGGDGFAKSYSKGKFWTFLDLVGGLQGIQ